MPSEFNSQELSAVTGLTQKTAQDQLRKMVQWGEVVETSAYKKPRTYRKVTV
jgi:Fic family protein